MPLLVPTQNGEQRVWPLNEARRELGDISRATLYRYFQQGEIAKIKHGGRTYVSDESLADYWQRQSEIAEKERTRRARSKRAKKSKKTTRSE